MFISFSPQNYVRVVEVWWDEYKDYFYASRPESKALAYGDISELKKFREDHNCKSFKWFMEEIAYDITSHYPLPPKNVDWGEVSVSWVVVCVFGDWGGESRARRKCWGREKSLRRGSLVENKASERRVWARQTASLVLLVWPKSSFGFSMHRHRKPQMNFLAKPNNLPSKLGGSHSEEVASEGAWGGVRRALMAW